MQHVYIIGSKGIPARYGGYETFVEKLTAGQVSSEIKYHVASRRDNTKLSRENDIFEYNGAEVYSIDVPNIGPAQAIVYDIKALKWAINSAEKIGAESPIFYILAARIGPFIGNYVKQIHNLGGIYFINPDGHEWKRAKWPFPVRKYWKFSERKMIKHADLIICDNPAIERYIQMEYKKYTPHSTYLSYGTDIQSSSLNKEDNKVRDWYRDKKLHENEYFLVVGRFVPENNYETMLREFMKSSTKKDFVLITNVEKNKFYDKLLKQTHFDRDPRIKFVGTVYDQELLKYIRENAFAYFHGHEVGGTNPSLLEAMATTKLNLLVDVDFNREVAGKSAIYWTKDQEALCTVIMNTLQMSNEQLKYYSTNSRERVSRLFNWELIISEYEKLLLKK
ncbi:beta 1-4 rhamnosyltransferase Cps2T [Weissella paramesenteroides]|uniref:beta 1-4 rhamnosyltransferase Cps2T n=1 Tax=Weissella paramesenteroides TaxID=1249 RepID=UPI003F74607A